jgi:uncharacterized protein (DUF2062 family)
MTDEIPEHEEARWIERHQRHLRWARRLLKYMPRRSNVHRYPGLSWAGSFARKRMYLWSFRYREVAIALYAGCIVSFLPIMGIQIPVALALALLLRANLPVFVGLQFITNWVTAVPIYYVCYDVGRIVLKLFGGHVEALGKEQLRLFIEQAAAQDWAANGGMLLRVFLVTSLGGAIIGSFVGTILDRIYSVMLWRGKVVWTKVRLIHERRRARTEAARKAREASVEPPPPTPPQA